MKQYERTLSDKRHDVEIMAELYESVNSRPIFARIVRIVGLEGEGAALVVPNA